MASTYLFYGKDGIGKWNLAIWLAALVNCRDHIEDESGKIIDICGNCSACRSILDLKFPEMHFALPLPPHRTETEFIDLTLEYLDTKRKEPYSIIQSNRQLSIPIKTAREIKRKTSIRPDKDIIRIILFYQMERMLAASADSLLKLIEEPPPSTIIILTARDPDQLLQTIQSRSQKIALKALAVTEIGGYLKEIYELDETRAALLAQLADGSLGRAIAMADENEDENSFRQVAFLMFKSLFHPDTPTSISAVNELIQPRNRSASEETLAVWQSFLGDLILLKYSGPDSEIVNIDLKKELENLAGKINDLEVLSGMISEIKIISQAIRRNIHIRPAFIDLSFRMRGLINQSS